MYLDSVRLVSVNQLRTWGHNLLLIGSLPASQVSHQIKEGLYPATPVLLVHLLNGHFRNLNWRCLPYMKPVFEAYVSGNMPKKMGRNMVRT